MNETDIFTGRPCWKACLTDILVGILLLPFFGLGLIVFLNLWIKIKSIKYRITDQRVIVTLGLVSRRIEEVELFRVQDVKLVQDIADRMMGTGNIIIHSTDQSTPIVNLMGLNNPLPIKEQLRTAYLEARRTHKVHATEFLS